MSHVDQSQYHRHKHVIPETPDQRANRQRLLAEYEARRRAIDEAMAAAVVRRVEAATRHKLADQTP